MKKDIGPLSYSTKTNVEWSKDLEAWPETIKLPGENTGKELLGTGLGSDSSDTTPKAQAAKAEISKREDVDLKAPAQQRK